MKATMQVDRSSASESTSNDEDSTVLENNGDHAYEVSHVDGCLAVPIAWTSMR